MYIASGNVLFSYRYDKNAGEDYWKTETSPGGNILQIASTGDYLYALCSTDKNNDGRTVVKRLDKDNSIWQTIGGVLDDYAKIQDIFAADGVLYVWAVISASNYINNILYIKNGEEAKNIMDNQNDTGRITGAAFNGTSCFLSFTGRKTDKDDKISGGVYKINDANSGAEIIAYKNQEGNLVNVHFNGIINLGNDTGNIILLISRNGEIFTVNNSIEKINNVSMNRMSTGALAIYYLPDGKKLLLAGRQDSLYYSATSGYSYGYMELELDAAGVKSGAVFSEPGRNPSYSTIFDYERYQSSLGKYPINFIFQIPLEIDSNMTLFAATQKNGVWSCRDRENNNNQYWNAEGEDEPKD
jgi:hypothetical protein